MVKYSSFLWSRNILHRNDSKDGFQCWSKCAPYYGQIPLHSMTHPCSSYKRSEFLIWAYYRGLDSWRWGLLTRATSFKRVSFIISIFTIIYTWTCWKSCTHGRNHILHCWFISRNILLEGGLFSLHCFVFFLFLLRFKMSESDVTVVMNYAVWYWAITAVGIVQQADLIMKIGHDATLLIQ